MTSHGAHLRVSMSSKPTIQVQASSMQAAVKSDFSDTLFPNRTIVVQ